MCRSRRELSNAYLLAKSASIQPRTSPSKLGGKFNSLFICLLIQVTELPFPHAITIKVWHVETEDFCKVTFEDEEIYPLIERSVPVRIAEWIEQILRYLC